jgi:hypothetical protein
MKIILLSVGIFCLSLGNVLAEKVITCRVESIWDLSGCVFSNVTIEENEVVSIATDPENVDVNTIEALEFSSSSIYSVPREVFTKFPNLKKFYADGQNIHEITPDTFADAKDLEVIQLQRNQLTFLHVGTFKSILIINFQSFFLLKFSL